MRAVGTQPCGPVNQNKELKLKAGSCIELQTEMVVLGGIECTTKPSILQGVIFKSDQDPVFIKK